MKCREIIERLERLAPPALACDWDNPGLLVGRRDMEIEKVYVALDADDDAVEAAVRKGAGLLLTHHPMIFQPLKKVNDDSFIGRRVLKLIENQICYYAMHTNFDGTAGGMADIASNRLGLLDISVLEELGALKQGETLAPYGFGRVGTLQKPLTIRQLGRLVKERFGLPFLTVYGEWVLGNEPVSRVAVSPGSGKREIAYAIEKKAQVLITGDIGHHEGIDGAACRLVIMDAGHYGLEHIFTDFMEEFLKREISGLTVEKAPVVFPAKII